MVEEGTVPPIRHAAAAAALLITTDAAVTADDRITRPMEVGQAELVKRPLTTVSETTTTVDPQPRHPWRQGFFHALL